MRKQANYPKRITDETARVRKIAAGLPKAQRHALLNACGSIEMNARRQSKFPPEVDNRTPQEQNEQIAEQYNTAQKIVEALLAGRTVSQRNSAEFKTTAFHSRIADARKILYRDHFGYTLCSRYVKNDRTAAGRPYKEYWLVEAI